MSEILVGIDGSAGAEDALAFAQRLAGPAGASLRLVSAFPYSDMHSRASNEAFRETLRDEAQAMLDRTAASTEGAVVTTDAIADVSPPHALHSLAERVGAALVVVGSTHHGLVGRVLPGSTAERLLHGSPCPVAIVPHGYATQSAGPIKTIGVGYDGTDESHAALAAACEVARRFGADLRVIRVFDAARVGTPAMMTIPGYVTVKTDYEAAQREGLERAVVALPDDVSAEAVFVVGSADTELVAQSEGVDLMVVGSRGYGPLAAVLLGGVTHTLVRKAACPVIVLPPARTARRHRRARRRRRPPRDRGGAAERGPGDRPGHPALRRAHAAAGRGRRLTRGDLPGNPRRQPRSVAARPSADRARAGAGARSYAPAP